MIAALLVAGVLGLPVPDWPDRGPEQWVQGGPVSLSGLRGKVVLIRFFTDAGCPYCRATAPTLNALHEEFSTQGLVVIGIYTPKPRPSPTTADDVRRVVKEYGFVFPVAVDADWGALRRLWLDRVPEARFTSASLLVDRRGILRHIQEGGAYGPDSTDPKERNDYAAMRASIARLLAADR